mmetsp:Transcript_25201/g.58597  ORF Transcript_25201/g.58597 Transcript_25201/m.58597 type:complete len:208 (-) Transcript_25201:69-692(-)
MKLRVRALSSPSHSLGSSGKKVRIILPPKSPPHSAPKMRVQDCPKSNLDPSKAERANNALGANVLPIPVASTSMLYNGYMRKTQAHRGILFSRQSSGSTNRHTQNPAFASASRMRSSRNGFSSEYPIGSSTDVARLVGNNLVSTNNVDSRQITCVGATNARSFQLRRPNFVSHILTERFGNTPNISCTPKRDQPQAKTKPGALPVAT